MNKFFKVINRAINKVIRRTDWYKSLWTGAEKFWGLNRFNLDIINLGSGASTFAFDYSESGIEGANLALSPQSLAHDFKILRNYFSFLRDGGVVLITVCPFSGLKVEYDKAHNLKYYTFLHPATIDNFEETERIRALKLKTDPFKYYPFTCFKNTIRSVLSTIKHALIPTKRIDFHTSAKDMIKIWMRQFNITDLSTPLTLKHKTEQDSRKNTLRQIVDFCKERSLQPVIVIPPMHPELTSMFPSAFYDIYLRPLLENIDAPIYDYMGNSFYKKDEYFRTALFLSQKGALKFTSDLVKRLNSDNILYN